MKVLFSTQRIRDYFNIPFRKNTRISKIAHRNVLIFNKFPITIFIANNTNKYNNYF